MQLKHINSQVGMKMKRGRGGWREPRSWQTTLRHQLESKAFAEKYPCIRCGVKENIHIHHLLYTGNKEEFFDPRFWVPLCQKCHVFAHSKEYAALISDEGQKLEEEEE